MALPLPPPAAHLRRRSHASWSQSAVARRHALKVLLPSPLFDYTANRREVEAEGATLTELLRDLDRRYPGIRFRMIDEQDAIRKHIRIFVNREMVRALDVELHPRDEILVVAALSGG